MSPKNLPVLLGIVMFVLFLGILKPKLYAFWEVFYVGLVVIGTIMFLLINKYKKEYMRNIEDKTRFEKFQKLSKNQTYFLLIIGILLFLGVYGTNINTIGVGKIINETHYSYTIEDQTYYQPIQLEDTKTITQVTSHGNHKQLDNKPRREYYKVQVKYDVGEYIFLNLHPKNPKKVIDYSSHFFEINTILIFVYFFTLPFIISLFNKKQKFRINHHNQMNK